MKVITVEKLELTDKEWNMLNDVRELVELIYANSKSELEEVALNARNFIEDILGHAERSELERDR